ncbi:MAG: hypothetical protein ACKVOR_04050 [Flavobacteriales bacterium]
MARKKEREPITGRIHPKKLNARKLKDANELIGSFELMEYLHLHMPPGMTILEICRQMGISRTTFYDHCKKGQYSLGFLVALQEITGIDFVSRVMNPLPDRFLENRLTATKDDEKKQVRAECNQALALGNQWMEKYQELKEMMMKRGG